MAVRPAGGVFAAFRLIAVLFILAGLEGCGKREISIEDRLRSQAQVQYGIHLAETGKLDSARIVLERAVSYDSTNVEALYRLGMIYEYLLQPDKAEAVYRQALRQDSLAGPIHLNLGQICGRNGRYDEALRHFDAAIRADTTREVRALSYYCIGLTQGIRGNSRAAAKAYQQATGLDSLFGRAYVGAGQELVRLGRFEEAVPVLKRAIAVDSTLSEAYSHLAAAYRMLNRMDEAAAVEQASRRMRDARRKR